MSFKEKIKQRVEEYKTSRDESKAFKKELSEQELQIRRNAYKEEALKQAEVRGRELAIARANKPTFKERVSSFANKAQSLAETKPQTPVRRVVRRRVTPRIKRIKRSTNVIRTVKRKVTPKITRKIKRRTVKKKTTKRKSVTPKRKDPFAATMNWGF